MEVLSGTIDPTMEKRARVSFAVTDAALGANHANVKMSLMSDDNIDLPEAPPKSHHESM